MSFQYVHTTGDVIETNQLKLIDEYVNNYLFSLIQGLRQQNFGFDTLHRITQEIKEYRQVLGTKHNFFIDSGGYSIIVGDVEPRSIAKFIECYNMFLERDAPEYCDFIFSLDIPVFLKYPTYNTFTYIYEMNSRSISQSKKILQENKDLYNKFIFVWQFKLPKQYEVWKRVYEENFADDINLRHFGIGGLVGLRGVTGIKFSPFIAMMYKCLKIFYEKNLDTTHILHVLGVYGLHDRVIMSFLHKLFNIYYLKNSNCKVQVTYDTVNYALSGLYKLRELEMYIPENNIYHFGYAHELINKMHLVIDDADVLEIVLKDLKNINEGKQVQDTHIASLLNVIAQSIIDKIIDDEIEKNNIVDLFLSSGNFYKFRNKFLPLLKSWEKKYLSIFGNRTEKNLLNFQYCYAFHQWWNNGRNETELEKLIKKFISLINFPFDLQE